MSYIKLWVDDVRPMPNEYNKHAKTAKEAIETVRQGNVIIMSLDHDLGEGGSGYDVACEIEKLAHDNVIMPIVWRVHSMNPVGRDKIIAALRKADEYWLDW